MTSSLVGSEMCIRDRLQTAQTQRTHTQLRRPQTTHTIDRADSLPLTPVSYTHLTLPTICSV
eukprot:9476525-Prorocentrum_lima.AAC.1